MKKSCHHTVYSLLTVVTLSTGCHFEDTLLGDQAADSGQARVDMRGRVEMGASDLSRSEVAEVADMSDAGRPDLSDLADLSLRGMIRRT